MVVVAIDAIDAIDAIEAIDYIEAVGFWGCGLGGMEEIKKSASPKKNCACGGGVGGCVGVGIEGRAQNIAPLHLMRCLIAGYNLVGALEGRAQNIATPQNYKTILPIKP